MGSTEKEIYGNKQHTGTTIAEGIEGTIIHTAYSTIGYKMLKSMKALKYKDQKQAASASGNAQPTSTPQEQDVYDPEAKSGVNNENEDGDNDENESQFRIGHGKMKKIDDDPQLYYVLS